jgi:hypothetical protein
LIAILLDLITADDLSSAHKERVDAVKKLVKMTLTSCLQYNKDTATDLETEYMHNAETSDTPGSKIPEDYENDIRRAMFKPTVDFSVNNETGEILDASTKRGYYAYQLANQMHTCCKTCWKYGLGRTKKDCRFHYPVLKDTVSADDCTIVRSVDKKSRKHVKILPPRNNGWVNPLPTHPLVVYANQGNMDVQYISNVHGAVEYTCSYISKAEAPDEKLMVNLFVRKLAILLSDSTDSHSVSKRDELRAAGLAVVKSQHVGAVQCCYTMLGLKYVTLSRRVLTISSLPTAELSRNVITDLKELEYLRPGETALSEEPTSHFGRRLAYYRLCVQQWNDYKECNVSLFTVVSTYAITKPKTKRLQQQKPSSSTSHARERRQKIYPVPGKLQLNTRGIVSPKLRVPLYINYFLPKLNVFTQQVK